MCRVSKWVIKSGFKLSIIPRSKTKPFPGRHTKNYWSHGPVEIVELPSYKMLDFPMKNATSRSSFDPLIPSAQQHSKSSKLTFSSWRGRFPSKIGLFFGSWGFPVNFPKKTNPLTISETIPKSFRKALKINRKTSGKHTKNYGKSLQN